MNVLKCVPSMRPAVWLQHVVSITQEKNGPFFALCIDRVEQLLFYPMYFYFISTFRIFTLSSNLWREVQQLKDYVLCQVIKHQNIQRKKMHLHHFALNKTVKKKKVCLSSHIFCHCSSVNINPISCIVSFNGFHECVISLSGQHFRSELKAKVK